MVRDYLEQKELMDGGDSEHELKHWDFNHMYDQIVIFVYDLCCLIFPKKKFIICDSQDHTFVMCEDEKDIMYDINWFIIGIPADHVMEQRVKRTYTRSEYLEERYMLCDMK